MTDEKQLYQQHVFFFSILVIQRVDLRNVMSMSDDVLVEIPRLFGSGKMSRLSCKESEKIVEPANTKPQVQNHECVAKVFES